MQYPTMKFGIEFECGLNSSNPIIDRRASYGSGKPDKYYKLWIPESDGSLSFNGYSPIELKSVIINNLTELKMALNQLGRIIFHSKSDFTKNTLLDGFASINKTCGCHLHFGETADIKKVFYETLQTINKKYMRYLYKYDKDQEIAYEQHYYRDYAICPKKYGDLLKERNHERRMEFKDNKGIEWRSFNLMGVKTWGDIVYRITRAYKLLLCNYKRNFKVPNSFVNNSLDLLKINAEIKAIRSSRTNGNDEIVISFSTSDGRDKRTHIGWGVYLVEKNYISTNRKLNVVNDKEIRIKTDITNNVDGTKFISGGRKKKHIYKVKNISLDIDATIKTLTARITGEK